MRSFFESLFEGVCWLAVLFGAALIVMLFTWWFRGDPPPPVHLQFMVIVYAVGGTFTFFAMMTFYYRQCSGIPALHDYAAYFRRYGWRDMVAAFGIALTWPFQWKVLDMRLKDDRKTLREVFRDVIIRWCTGRWPSPGHS